MSGRSQQVKTWVRSLGKTLAQTLTQTLKSGLILGVVLLLLTGCGARGPESKVVKRAIAIEFEQTQQALSQQLRTPVPKFKIERVSVKNKTPLRLEGLQGFRVQGEYDANVKFPKQRYEQHHNPFDVYLQQQSDGETWRLAIPQKGKGEVAARPQWTTYQLFEPKPEKTAVKKVEPKPIQTTDPAA